MAYKTVVVGSQQITGMAAATKLTVPAGADRAVVSCDNAAGVSVRYWSDGTVPTASVGVELLPGSEKEFVSNIGAVQFIQTASGAILNVEYFK